MAALGWRGRGNRERSTEPEARTDSHRPSLPPVRHSVRHCLGCREVLRGRGACHYVSTGLAVSCERRGGLQDEDQSYCARSGGAGGSRSAYCDNSVGGQRQQRLRLQCNRHPRLSYRCRIAHGGGSYDPASGFVKAAGGFRCTADVGQGPLAGCLTGQGVRWDTVELRASTTFKCTGSAAEALKTAVTDENTVVLLADFYRAGDGVDESFTAQMIVSADDIAADVAGTQNVWIQGVGCAPGVANFSS
jgi:hypothetical protein